MRRSIWLMTVALAFVAACSGDEDDIGLTGRWEAVSSQSAYEFLPDGRFVQDIQTMDGTRTRQGTYTASDGLLTLRYDEEPGAEEYRMRLATPFWTDGDTLEMSFLSPDHDSDAIAGTWRSQLITDTRRSDGTVTTNVVEIVNEYAADGTVVEEYLINGTSDFTHARTYTVTDGAVVIDWPEQDSVTRTLRDRRLASDDYVRAD